MAAYCTIQAAITEMYSDEAKSFDKFPALAEQFIQANSNNYIKIQSHPTTGSFQVAFFMPAATRNAFKHLQTMYSIDGRRYPWSMHGPAQHPYVTNTKRLHHPTFQYI
jgi:hypothetical protein